MKLCFMVNLTEELVVAICVDIQCWIPVSVSGNITSFSGFFLSYTTIKDAKLCIQTETWAARTDVPLSCGLPFKNTSHFQHFQTSLVRSSRSEPRWILWVTHTYIYLDPLFQRPWRYKVCLSIKALPLKARRMGALLLFPSRSRRRGSVREAIGCCCRPLSECSPSSSRTRSQMDFFYFQRRRSQGPGCVLEPSSSSKFMYWVFFFCISNIFSELWTFSHHVRWIQFAAGGVVLRKGCTRHDSACIFWTFTAKNASRRNGLWSHCTHA